MFASVIATLVTINVQACSKMLASRPGLLPQFASFHSLRCTRLKFVCNTSLQACNFEEGYTTLRGSYRILGLVGGGGTPKFGVDAEGML